jgi:hypothetical protein
MRIRFGLLRLAGAMSALVGLGPMVACTTGDSDAPANGAGGTVASGGGTGGTVTPIGGSGGTSTSVAGAGLACVKPKVLTAAKPSIASFDTYDGGSDLKDWSFAMGGDASTGIVAGTFGYGDRDGSLAETFDMAPGYNSLYGLRVADTASQVYGGGLGIWMSECLNATVFSGLTFWVRGAAPTGKAKVSVLMQETQPATAANAKYKTGTCQGVAEKTCIHPNNEFPVTDTWAQIQIPWASFGGGNAAGTPVAADGHNIWQVQWDIGLVWMPGEAGAYVAVPGAYELEIDSVAFY